MKKYILMVFMSVCGLTVFAQAEFDALRLSQTDIIGTARYVSMSGAFGALGGDMSAIGLNPAGIGIYRSSEVSFSPSLQQDFSKADFNGKLAEANRLKVLMNGFGYVGSFRTYDESAISNFNFGISYQTVADFNRNTNVLGVDRPTSLLDRIVAVENTMWNDNGTHPYHSNFYSFVNGVHVIEQFVNDNNENRYRPRLDNGELVSLSNMKMQETGGINSWNFTLGANYNHNLYLGIGIGIQSVLYEKSTIFSEEYQLGGGTELRNAMTTTGSGIDFKAGVIYRPVPELRLGVSYRSGTYYTLTDVFNASMASWNFRDPITDVLYNPDPKVIGNEQTNDYMLKTPWQLTLSAAYQFENKGLFSVDFECVDSRSTDLKSGDGFEMEDINYYMENDFKLSYNVRVGGEMRLTDNVSARLGAAYYMSPLVSQVETYDIATAYTSPEYSVVKSTWYGSMGLGYRSGAFFADAALQERVSNEHFYNFCDMSNINVPKFADLSRRKMNLVLTAGFKF
ncbi:MAG TPA: hypothetical protein VFP20_01915 [Bacteroidales bacterium]|nr:hypothetical protein [Bacteroidales bacterium]